MVEGGQDRIYVETARRWSRSHVGLINKEIQHSHASEGWPYKDKGRHVKRTSYHNLHLKQPTCLAVARVERWAGRCRRRGRTHQLPHRVSERAVQSVIARFFVTTSKVRTHQVDRLAGCSLHQVSPSLLSVVLHAVEVSSVSLDSSTKRPAVSSRSSLKTCVFHSSHPWSVR